MQEYVGQPCIVCGRAFAEQDDIVTCPECGTPYHRACWQQKGACINTVLHAEGASWILRRREAEKAAKEQERRAEEAEQAAARERDDSALPELYDGVRLNPDDPCIGLNPEEQLDGVTIREAAAFIRTNRFYYLPIFRLMKRTGRKITFNFLTLLYPPFYFANRKMWGSAMAALLLNSLLEIPTIIKVLSESDVHIPWADVTTSAFHSIYTASFALYFLVSLIWCFFGNYLYYRYAQRKIRSIKKEAASPEETEQKLQDAGGTSLLNVFLVLGMQFVITRVTGFLLMIVR